MEARYASKGTNSDVWDSSDCIDAVVSWFQCAA